MTPAATCAVTPRDSQTHRGQRGLGKWELRSCILPGQGSSRSRGLRDASAERLRDTGSPGSLPLAARCSGAESQRFVVASVASAPAAR